MLVLAVADLLGAEELAVHFLAVGGPGLARGQHDRQALPVARVLLAGERRQAQAGPAEDLVRHG